ncbi:hypothetical protein QNM97_06635 [Gordonia sp. L191]|uniref:hypothetical protein n=1 Tax=Gordonia sp. L191 TaxID=2982699 RepID=UPI0024BF46A0|nr:hypothetical protein [Gordonia sp. L191]WHU48665.1 hypothetical protein QNM97_06635 [Gordonia sp. L191]
MTSANALPTDPASLTPPQWQARLAAFASRGVPDTDSRVEQCRAALAYWRCRRVLDAERGQIAPAHLDDLVEHLREAVATA